MVAGAIVLVHSQMPAFLKRGSPGVFSAGDFQMAKMKCRFVSRNHMYNLDLRKRIATHFSNW